MTLNDSGWWQHQLVEEKTWRNQKLFEQTENG